jgi:type IV secretory pathway VirB4 component
LASIKVNLDNENVPTEREEIKTNLNSMEILVSLITTGNEILKNVTFNVLLTSYLQKQFLSSKEHEIKEICQQYNLGLEGNYLNQQHAFLACLPKINHEKQVFKQLISSQTLAAFFPFQN